ncbi:hypothetical protein C5167_051119 [Papaver somniferum]|uniref:Thioesterase domain-containing protein n=1 Tax=Papaver somniferum TaxID=3469 RepID=A0A4Y7KTF6_PAPSO|nr:hypothetical protein C5167_051119 [Papaver somniferum]
MITFTTDGDANWHVGAIATLIDIGASDVHTTHANIHASVKFKISYFSSVKVQDEVEIEAKVLGHQGNLSSDMMVIKMKENGDLVVIGKPWILHLILILKIKIRFCNFSGAD